jgi:hypothetical protein
VHISSRDFCLPAPLEAFSFALAAKSIEFDLIESTAAESETNAHPQYYFLWQKLSANGESFLLRNSNGFMQL